MNQNGPSSDSDGSATAPPAPFEQHDIRWTRETSARFWDGMGPIFARAGMYFSDHLGGSLLRYARAAGVPLQGRVLDFGCGPGYLIGHMLRQGVPAAGVDFSSAAVEQVRERFSGHPLFRGVTQIDALPTGFAAGSFDVVFLVETVEHLLDDDLDATMTEIGRLVAPGGWLVVSTPNDQELWREQTMCPECGCRFHVTQHVRSWTASSLTDFMSKHGFAPARAEGVFFGPTRWHTMLLPYLKRRRPHLVYIGRRQR